MCVPTGRHQLNCEYVMKNTASFWGSTFITELSSIELFNQIPPLRFDDIMSDFAKSKKRYPYLNSTRTQHRTAPHIAEIPFPADAGCSCWTTTAPSRRS